MKKYFSVTSRVVTSLLLTVSLFLGMNSVASANTFDYRPNSGETVKDAEGDIEYVEYEDLDWDEINKTITSVKRLGRISEKIQVKKAKKVNYQPQSGVEMVWEDATAHRYLGQKFVTVPLASDGEDVNQVIFTWAEGGLHVQEVYGERNDDDANHVRVWTDSVLTVERYVVDNEPNIDARGLSWSKFKNCMTRSGLSLATIAVIDSVCSVGCSFGGPYGCTFCAAVYAGANLSIVGSCVYDAWV